MKKTLIGIGLIALAAFLLFRDYLNIQLDLPIWQLLLALFFAVDAIQNLFRKSYTISLCEAVIVFILLNQHYHWLRVGTGTIVVAGILLCIGIQMIFKKQKSFGYYRSKSGLDKVVGWAKDDDMEKVTSSDSDTVFGGSTRYIDTPVTNVSGDTVFSTSSVYFTEGTILGDKATYSGDTVFSTLKLYVPKTWSVRVTGDTVMSAVKVHPSGAQTDKILEVTGDFVFSRLEVHYL